jgi:hypothetical protein
MTKSAPEKKYRVHSTAYLYGDECDSTRRYDPTWPRRPSHDKQHFKWRLKRAEFLPHYQDNYPKDRPEISHPPTKINPPRLETGQNTSKGDKVTQNTQNGDKSLQ